MIVHFVRSSSLETSAAKHPYCYVVKKRLFYLLHYSDQHTSANHEQLKFKMLKIDCHITLFDHTVKQINSHFRFVFCCEQKTKQKNAMCL